MSSLWYLHYDKGTGFVSPRIPVLILSLVFYPDARLNGRRGHQTVPGF